jgi:hypothetical protein
MIYGGVTMPAKKRKPPVVVNIDSRQQEDGDSNMKGKQVSPENAFIQELIKIKVDHVNKLKSSLESKLCELSKLKKPMSVRDLFPNFQKSSVEHKFLMSLREKDIARPQGGGHWKEDKTIVLTAAGVDIAKNCGLPIRPIVFVSYSHKDIEWKERVEEHLSVLNHTFIVDIWSDKNIETGSKWRVEINDALMRAKAVILLLSSSFFHSKFIREKEIPEIKKKLQGDFDIFPILVRPCAWKAVDWIEERQILPENGEPLSSGDGNFIDSKLSDITIELNKKFQELDTETSSKSI